MAFKERGFTLVELMVVIAIIGLLSVIAAPRMFKYVAKAKRAEAYAVLSSLALAQKAYYAEHGSYAQSLTGPLGLGWRPEGAVLYTYGFAGGQEGVHYFVGKLQAPASGLSGARADKNGFLLFAAADIDGDGELDILSVDQAGTIALQKDDLSD